MAADRMERAEIFPDKAGIYHGYAGGAGVVPRVEITTSEVKR